MWEQWLSVASVQMWSIHSRLNFQACYSLDAQKQQHTNKKLTKKVFCTKNLWSGRGKLTSSGPVSDMHSALQGPFLPHYQCLLLLLLGSLLAKSTKIINEDSFLKGFVTVEDTSQLGIWVSFIKTLICQLNASYSLPGTHLVLAGRIF